MPRRPPRRRGIVVCTGTAYVAPATHAAWAAQLYSQERRVGADEVERWDFDAGKGCRKRAYLRVDNDSPGHSPRLTKSPVSALKQGVEVDARTPRPVTSPAIPQVNRKRCMSDGLEELPKDCEPESCPTSSSGRLIRWNSPYRSQEIGPGVFTSRVEADLSECAS